MPTELSYHCNLSKIGRSQGRSSTAAAAYRSGERIVDERTGEIFDYRRKRGIEASLIVLPKGGTMDRGTLWNKVEMHHKRGDAVVCREIEVSLPRTLSPEQRLRLVRRHAAKLADRYGVAVDACIHEPHAVSDADLADNPAQFFVEEADGSRHNGNWHCHMLLTACHCDAQGALGKKVVELDEVHCIRAGIANAAQEQRPAWAAAVNEALAEAGQDYFVDHRSFQERGITEVPTEHRGPAVTAIMRRRGQSHVAEAQTGPQLGRFARAAEAANKAVEAIHAELTHALAEHASQVAAVAGAAMAAVVAPMPTAAIAAPVPVVHQVDQVEVAQALPEPAKAVAPEAPEVRMQRARDAREKGGQTGDRRDAAEAQERRVEKALKEARERQRRHGPRASAAQSEAEAKGKAAQLAKEHRELEAKIKGRGFLARLLAKFGDADAERLEALWPKVQEADQAAKAARIKTVDAEAAASSAASLARDLAKAQTDTREAQRAHAEAIKAALPYRAEIGELGRLAAAESEAEAEAERLQQAKATRQDWRG